MIKAKWPSEAILRSWVIRYNNIVFYTYIIFSKKLNIYYSGSTSDLKRRLLEHNKKQVDSTISGIPWKLVWYGGFNTLKKAQQFEKYLKSSSGFAFRNKRLI